MGPKKRKSYFSQPHLTKKKKWFLQSGMKGFFCTCNGKEKDCIKEALNLLDEHYTKLFPKADSSEINKGDIENELQKEIAELKTSSVHNKPFQVVDTEVKSCVFIKTTLDDPLQLASSIFGDIVEQKTLKSKFLLRLVPIEITCKAYIDDIKKAADEIFDAHFKCEPTTYAVIYNHRCNNSVVRSEVIESLCILVRDRNLGHSVNIKNPLKAIVVEIVKGVCCLSVVPNFFHFKKYNLLKLAEDLSDSTKSEVPPSRKDECQSNGCKEIQDEENTSEVS